MSSRRPSASHPVLGEQTICQNIGNKIAFTDGTKYDTMTLFRVVTQWVTKEDKERLKEQKKERFSTTLVNRARDLLTTDDPTIVQQLVDANDGTFHSFVQLLCELVAADPTMTKERVLVLQKTDRDKWGFTHTALVFRQMERLRATYAARMVMKWGVYLDELLTTGLEELTESELQRETDHLLQTATTPPPGNETRFDEGSTSAALKSATTLKAFVETLWLHSAHTKPPQTVGRASKARFVLRQMESLRRKSGGGGQWQNEWREVYKAAFKRLMGGGPRLGRSDSI